MKSRWIATLLLLLASVSATLAQGYIHVSSPAAGVVWRRGQSYWIRWDDNVGGDVYIQLYRSQSFDRAIVGTIPNSGSYLWTIADNQPPGNDYQVKIVSVLPEGTFGWSDCCFTIAIQPTVEVLSPNGGEHWLIGSAHTITWTDNFSGNLRLELLRGGVPVTVLSDSAPNTGAFTWRIARSLPEDANYAIRISGILEPAAVDTSDSTFTLTRPPFIHLRIPNNGKTWFVGDVDTIRWTSLHIDSENVRIELKRDYPNGNWIALAASAPNTGSYPWLVSAPTTSTARARIGGTIHPAVRDTSDADFSISANLSAPVVVIWADSDSCRLTWRAVPGATAYQVWGTPAFEDPNTLLEATTSDTSVWLNNQTSSKRLYHVVSVR